MHYSKWVVMVLVMLCCTMVVAKDSRTYYTEERLGWMRQNLAEAAWAAEERERIIERADRWIDYDDSRLADLVPPLEVARCGRIHYYGCPRHGDAILKYPGGKNSWKISFDRMYKVECPIDGEVYPDNDFYAYLKSGCKDKSLLSGEIVDDGWGAKLPGHENKFWFVGYFAGRMVREMLIPAINNLSKAYLITGDAKYGHKAAVLLWQLAQYYPEYYYEKQSRYGLEFQPWYVGRLQYHTGETFTVQDVALAYDAVYPLIGEDVILQEWTGKSADQIRADIEERILRVAAKDITDGSHRIQGNYGMHQSALLRIALVLDTDEGELTSADMVNWVMKGPERVSLYTDTPLPDAIVNLMHRDGVPFESPSYNCGWMTELEDVAELLLLNGVNMWEVPRFQALYTWGLRTTVCSNMSQPMGDSNNQFAAALGTTPTYLEKAYARIKDLELAAMMVQRDVNFRTDLFEKSQEKDIREAARQHDKPVGIESNLLPGLGYATLQTGNADNRTALALFYGYYTAHAHYERLNLELYAHNHSLLPDFGYPETAERYDPRRYGWLAHSAVHNTVQVNATRQSLGDGALVTYHPKAVDSSSWAQMIEASVLSAYPDITLDDFRRAAFLIDIDADTAYVADFFNIEGGQQHDWLIHGPPSVFSEGTVNFTSPRTEGTLAGQDVPYGKFYDDASMIEGKPGTSYYGYMGSAYQWLFNVQEAILRDTGTVRWDLDRDPNLYPFKETAGIGLRAHFVGNNEMVYACDGMPQRRADFPDTHKWIVRRRTGNELHTTFASVFEPFTDGNTYIDKVTELDVTPADGSVAIEIDHVAGTDVIFWTKYPDIAHKFSEYNATGRAALIRTDRHLKVVKAQLFDGNILNGPDVRLSGTGPVRSTIASIDYAHNSVTLDEPCLKAEHAGRWIVVDTGKHIDAVHIDEVINAYTFSLGTQDLRCGTGNVLGLSNGNVIDSDRVIYFAQPGMTVVNEALQPIGHFASRDAKTNAIKLAEETISDQVFNDVDGDGRKRFVIMAIGPGNRIEIPSLINTGASALIER